MEEKRLITGPLKCCTVCQQEVEDLRSAEEKTLDSIFDGFVCTKCQPS